MTKNDYFDTLDNDFDPSSGGDAASDDLDLLLSDLGLDYLESPQDGNQASIQVEPKDTEYADAPIPEEEPPASRGNAAKARKASNSTIREPETLHGFGGFLVRNHRMVNLVLLLICVVLAAGIAAVILVQSNADPLGGKIMENIHVAGVDVGGMTQEEATAAVKNAIAPNYAEGIMVVELGSEVLCLSSSQVHPALNVQAAVNAAFSMGRTGTASQRQKDYRKAQIAPVEISGAAYLTVDTDMIRSTVSDFLMGIAGAYSPSAYFLEGNTPALDAENFDNTIPCQTLVLEVGVPGSQFDLDGICAAILDAYSQNNFHVIISNELLPQMPERLDIDAIYQQYHVDPVEAQQEGSKTIPGSCGYTFDLEDARARLAAAVYGQVITLPMEYVVPTNLDGNGSFTETLSAYSTPVSSSDAYNQNMKLLCQKLNGLVLKPGDTFSFNQFFKDLSEKAGFQKAPRHGDCCMDEVMCGGMDQVASTLYVAAKTADLTVSEKHQGDHLCSYTTKGTELTVGSSWQDLKLSNSLKVPVRIRARVTDQKVIIQFLSEQAPKYYVQLETQVGYTIAHGTNFVARKASAGFTDGQVLVQGVDGGQITLLWVKYDAATKKEIGRTSEVVVSRAMNTVLAVVSR